MLYHNEMNLRGPAALVGSLCRMAAGGLLALLVFGVLAAATPAVAQVPSVVVSIKPIHSLITGVMKGIGSPHLMVKGLVSPHAFTLRPSEARLLENADVVFWVGEAAEPSLIKPLKSIGSRAHIVELLDVKDIRVLAAREGGAWNARDDDGHGHGKHVDGHIWLDPRNAIAITRIAAQVLAKRDPANAPAYRENADGLTDRLRKLDKDLAKAFMTVKRVPYVVYHDAYQYLERRFGLNAVGAISAHAGRAPGARRLRDLRELVIISGAHCVFHEPQFDPRLVQTLIESTDAATGILDPMGTKTEPGEDAYFEIMGDISRVLAMCLDEVG